MKNKYTKKKEIGDMKALNQSRERDWIINETLIKYNLYDFQKWIIDITIKNSEKTNTTTDCPVCWDDGQYDVCARVTE